MVYFYFLFQSTYLDKIELEVFESKVALLSMFWIWAVWNKDSIGLDWIVIECNVKLFPGPVEISLPVSSLRRVSGTEQFMDCDSSPSTTAPARSLLHLVEGLQDKLKSANSEIGSLGDKVKELNDVVYQKQCKILKLVKKNADLQRKVADLEEQVGFQGKLLCKFKWWSWAGPTSVQADAKKPASLLLCYSAPYYG